ncbi:class I SAM-dependent methyltransferase [Ancylobacter amanitiformis]|uniref:S-adenosylmethionine-dependent methyltransferase n=1 Tax=Ancylobacter amanitiformis TaxID=217069 RepID=A0ABU0LT66_9HYPH|nr:class I SAM-dependent methyltransferase [Ancylobacter amanitiformis]MDQ0511798.1 hypothetical protein [Ancylobacter amanitiformis]
MSTLSRLEKTLFRLQAQHACLAHAFAAIASRPGPVVELGLGLGRTFDHLRRHLPEREIHVFDRVNGAYEDCQPDPALLHLGEIEETVPALAGRLAGRVVLANADLGSHDRDCNRQLALEGFEEPPRPAGLREGCYYLYRRPA